MQHEGLYRNDALEETAYTVGAMLIDHFDPNLESRLAAWFDTIPFPDELVNDFVVTHVNPLGLDFKRLKILLVARDRRIPTRGELIERSEKCLLDQSRCEYVVNRPFFQVLYSMVSEELDLSKGPLPYPHPRLGFPTYWYHKEPGRIFPKRVEKISYDFTMCHLLYPDGARKGIFNEMKNLALTTMEQEIPKPRQEAIDNLRFLGLDNEEQFISKLEYLLGIKIYQKGGRERMERINHFMDFTKTTDRLRVSKRRTGESFYCHYLASAWILFTMLEEELNTPESIREAIEDTEVMFAHDLLEDFEDKARIESDGQNDFELTVQGIEGGIRLNYDQKLILEALKKEKDDDGSMWFDKIRKLRDPSNDTPERNNYLKRRVARCKAADRFANVLTISSAGGTYKDVIRKLEETKEAGRQLMRLTYLSGMPTFAAIKRLRKLDEKNRFETVLTGLPTIADMEIRLLLYKFGLDFIDNIFRNSSVWAQHIKSTIEEEVLQSKYESNRINPFWQRRQKELGECYRLNSYCTNMMVPAVNLGSYFGLEAFALELPFRTKSAPWNFSVFDGLVERLLRFEQEMIRGKGVLTGGVDDLYFPKQFGRRPDFLARL